MAGKEAIVVVLDVGATMANKYSQSNQTRIELALESVRLLVQQKNHEVGLVLFGTEETENQLNEQLGGYENVTVAQELAGPTLEFLRYVDMIKPTPQSGDWIDALVVAADMLAKHCQKRKYNKRIFLITDGQSKVGNTDDLKEVAGNLRGAEVKLNVIALDFCNELQFETPEEKAKAAESESPLQQNNKRLLLDLTGQIDGRIFPANIAMQIYHQFRKRAVYPVAKYRGSLEISKELNIQVMAYTKTKAESLPSLAKYSLVAEECCVILVARKAGDGKVKMDRTYCLVDDPEQTPIEADQKIKGYQYGKQLVPVSSIDEKLLVHEEQKCMKLLGFTSCDKVPRQHYMNGVDMLVPTSDKQNSSAFSSLIRAMHETNRVMVCRFLPRNNGVPHIAVLSPHISPRLQCMYINYLPTIEDLREYQFTAPKASTEAQQKAASDFIDSLDLTAGGEEQLKPKMTFNPVLQYLYQCIQHRALNPDNPKLPPLDENIAAYIKPDKSLFEAAESEVTDFAKAFELKKVEKDTKKANRVYWRDLISKEETKEVAKTAPEDSEVPAAMANEEVKEKGKGVFEPEEIKEISAVDPISDFKKMIGERHRDRVSEAIGQMKTMIKRFVEESLMGSSYDRALECLITLRDSCVKEDEPVEFNDFLWELKEKYGKGKHKQMWDMIVGKNITLITKEESINSLVEIGEAEMFLESNEGNNGPKKRESEIELMEEIE